MIQIAQYPLRVLEKAIFARRVTSGRAEQSTADLSSSSGKKV
jgi:hypothetical protein